MLSTYERWHVEFTFVFGVSGVARARVALLGVAVVTVATESAF